MHIATQIYTPMGQFPSTHLFFKWVSYSFIFPVIIDTPSPKSPHGEYNQRLVMFNFRSDLSQLPSLHFFLISFTYVTVIKGVHLSFLIAGERTGTYTGAFHKGPLTGSYHHKQTLGRCRMQYWTIFLVLFWILIVVDGVSLFWGLRQSRRWTFLGCKIIRGTALRSRKTKKRHCLICLVII